MFYILQIKTLSRYSDSLRTTWGSAPWWLQDLLSPSRLFLGSTQPPVNWIPVFLLRLRRPGRGVNHPPPSSTSVKDRVETCLHSPSGLSRPVTVGSLASSRSNSLCFTNYIHGWLRKWNTRTLYLAITNESTQEYLRTVQCSADSILIYSYSYKFNQISFMGETLFESGKICDYSILPMAVNSESKVEFLVNHIYKSCFCSPYIT